jgi:hypothetical protein
MGTQLITLGLTVSYDPIDVVYLSLIDSDWRSYLYHGPRDQHGILHGTAPLSFNGIALIMYIISI